MMFNAFLFAFFFARIAKCDARGILVIFSNKAIISNRPETPFPCFEFRLFDIDARHPVVEAHVRLYAVTQKTPIPIPLRVLIPNDDHGSMLFLSLPSQVVHNIDAYSPLSPSSEPKNNPQNCRTSLRLPNDNGLHLRQADAGVNNRDDVLCPVCGESYGTLERLIQHGKFNKLIETHDDIPYHGSHREVDWDEWEAILKKSTSWTLPQLEDFFRSSISEIICVVEGIESLGSGTFQALHSYQVDDIHFGQAHFADCVCLNPKKRYVVDMDFYDLIKPNETVTTTIEEVVEYRTVEKKEGEGDDKETTGTSTDNRARNVEKQPSVTSPAPASTSSAPSSVPQVPISAPPASQQQLRQQAEPERPQQQAASSATLPTQDDAMKPPRQVFVHLKPAPKREPPKPERTVLPGYSLRHMEPQPKTAQQTEPSAPLPSRSSLRQVDPQQNTSYTKRSVPTSQASQPAPVQQSSAPQPVQAAKPTLLPSAPVSAPTSVPAAVLPSSPQPLSDASFRSLRSSSTSPLPRIRRFSSPTNFDAPPPLFVIDTTLLPQQSRPQRGGQVQQNQQPRGRSSMPSNMMNSLATGKFE